MTRACYQTERDSESKKCVDEPAHKHDYRLKRFTENQRKLQTFSWFCSCQQNNIRDSGLPNLLNKLVTNNLELNFKEK